MNRTESGRPCQPWNTSIFKKFFNYTGNQFADKFIPGAVCRNPTLPAPNKTSPWCYTNINTLKSEKCYLSEGECPDGRFGPSCIDECHCQNLEPCDKHTGKCHQCYDGWIGRKCQKKCEASKYGTNCSETCVKCKDFLCDHETGKCRNGCNAGLIGDLCNAKCPDGRFGLNCLYECQCQNLESCDKHTGKCTYCDDGWTGRACQQKCEAGKYGTNCKNTCGKCKNILCDHETGQCLKGCDANWYGVLCNTSITYTSEKRNNSPWKITGIVLGGFLMVSMCLNIYCLLKRRRSSTTVSKTPLEDQYDDIGTINDKSASDRALPNNVQEDETIVDGPTIERVSHHLSSNELCSSSDDSVHNLSVSLLSGDGYEHPYQTIDPENIELHPYSTLESNVYQNTNFN